MRLLVCLKLIQFSSQENKDLLVWEKKSNGDPQTTLRQAMLMERCENLTVVVLAISESRRKLTLKFERTYIKKTPSFNLGFASSRSCRSDFAQYP